MSMGLIRPGIYLRPMKGRAYFFRTRDSKELIEVLGAWRGEPITKATPESHDEATREPLDEVTREDSAGTSSKADVVQQSTKAPAPVAPDPSPVEESHDDIDFDSIGAH